MTITNNIVAKAAVAFVAVAMAFSLVAPAAQAQDVSSMSLEQLVALVNSLQNQLGGAAASGSCAYTFTRSLGQGSTGADVMNLQKFLNMSADTQVAASGAGSAGMETSYYGPATAAAVSKFQTKYSADILVPSGLTSPTGYFGPSSMAKANAMCKAGGSTGGNTGGNGGNTGGLEGGAGDLAEADWISSLNNEEVGEGDEDVEVAGLEIEADGSDIEITAVALNFDYADTGASNDFDDYAEEVSIWLDGEEYARVDVSDLDDDDWSDNLSLEGGAIIREGDTGELVIAVTGVSNIDGSDIGEKWNVAIESVRYRDAQGATVTDSTTGDIGGGDDDTTTDSDEREFTFEDFATASDLEFSVSKGDDEINDARSIEVSSTTDTTGVEILSFEIALEGNSDVVVDAIPVDFATSTGDLLADLISVAELVVDGEVVGSESVSTSHNDDGIVLFDNLDWEISAGDTVEVIVRVDMKELNNGTFGAGATLAAAVNPDDSGWDIEDEEGDDVAAGDKTGSATSEAHSFYGDGINVKFVSATDVESTVDGSNNDYVTLTIKFDVTAFGEDAYVDKTVLKTGVSNDGTAVRVENASGTLLAAGSSSVTMTSTADEETHTFLVEEGDTETFTVRVVVDSNAGTLDNTDVRAILTGIGFSTTDTATEEQTYTSQLTTDFKTDYARIAD